MSEKTRAEGTIANTVGERKGVQAKNAGKTQFLVNGCGNRRDFRGNSTRSSWNQAAWYSSEGNVPRKNWRWKDGDENELERTGSKNIGGGEIAAASGGRGISGCRAGRIGKI
jgi:hypothetical protein